ncbi:MAG: hypothetical protein A2505_03530 [Deltaproteobacteria bacterium RIFOXYD12_FULL_55_16]|nr:MAG: hypothetical protein A2505_03530 [Deltaproteobacteria bacterium RIFOXYD12_FULL_55_16]
MDSMATCLASLRVRIDPEQIYFLKFILEAYDNLTIMSTVDRLEGVVELKYPPELGNEVRQLLQSMAQRLKLEDFNP